VKKTVADKAFQSQTQQKKNHDQTASERSINVGDCVNITNFGRGCALLAGTVVEKTGPLTCHIQLTDGRIVRRHVDHIHLRRSPAPDLGKPPDDVVEIGEPPPSKMNNPSPSSSKTAIQTPPILVAPPEEPPSTPAHRPVQPPIVVTSNSPVLRRSKRVPKPRKRLDL